MYPKAYIDYLVHFHGDRDYFECHEVLEEQWKRDGRKIEWLVLIQIAVAFYHYRRNNTSGALRLMKRARVLLEEARGMIRRLGLDDRALAALLDETARRIAQGKPYESIELPIADRSLYAQCRAACAAQQLVWGQASDTTDIDLVDKHRRRDRTDVIAAREQKKRARAEGK
ncbi:DUF309 domain-containing protein [Geobacillus thermodenitrificans]|uniref:DUF309 domain-containing protein n=2 Tax=Geobacillus thermodenitrificans TaxID=33940 RepID=A4IQG5_GEOTN|nr:DUF309 domain-containing protein [Geobacillus thermodenitrificans]ABO67569.1 Conserved hypothetical protein [Geobacillus thermodenitrificans NG80-2]MEC5187552.1 hypothetical protein [Geobacillus thermodenitrificans]MED4919296.1 DUF309 domain-containing protein [Geobacillus thermodenitrificans]PJW21888.1 DUF309 domain-containing protein [Geobacillus thermodenitrificans]